MKKSFHVFFLFVLFAFFAVNAARAAAICPEPLQEGSDGCFVNMPVTGTSTVNITADDIANGWTTFKVYDDGGKDENYSWNAEGYLTLNVPQGYVLQVGGVPMAYGVGERLKIFDGSSEGQVLFNEEVSSYTGNIGTYISTGNLLTLYFAASGLAEEYVLSGLDLTVKVIKMNLDLVADGEGDYYVNMLAQHTATLNITADDIENGITSFNVYDDGGKDGDYSWNANGCLVLTAPEGYMFQVEGDVRLLEGSVYYGKFTIYDGNSGNQELLDVSSNDLNIGKIISTANIVTLCLKSFARLDAPYSRAGLDLIVKVVKTNLDLVADGEGGYYVNMLSKRSAALTITTDDIGKGITSFNVYDDGGKDGEFSYDANDYLTITAPKGYVLQVTGDVYSRYGYSTGWLTVYDGNSKATQLQEESTNARVNVTSTDNVVTLYFKSTATSQNYTCEGGLDLLVTLLQSHIITINDVDGGSVTTDKEKATQGETVTLTISPDLNDYELTNLVVTYGTNNSTVNISVSENNTSATFTMPDGDVTVTPSWKALLIEDGESGYYVNMPVSGTKILDLAEYVANGVTSFKVYDDGGKDGNFTNIVDGYLVLTAPAGYQLLIQGSMKTFCSTSDNCSKGEFVVYDGNVGATEALHKWGNVSNINAYSSGNTMTLYFGFGAAGFNWDTDSGLDFTVSVITQHSVNIADVSGGKISTNKETADEGTTVTLTAAPDKGYILNSISVVGLDGKSVEINNGTWRIGVNTITFSMPKEAVFVSPLFIPANEFSIPKEGRVEVVIPEGVESFNVYDDGGKDGNYSNAADGKLQLTAPENYVFQVSGSATTEVAKDLLTIYDGAIDSDKKLLDEKSGSIDLNGANVLTSTNNIITIKFYSNGITNKSGFDLKVTLVKPTYGAVSIAKADDGKIHATINGDYEGTETLSIPEAIEVDAIDYNREIDVESPVTALLPVTLPAGTTVNADFYTLEKVEQVEGMKWQATMTYIGKNNLPQPNTPYAVILPKGQTKLEFDLKGNKATVQTGKIKKVCGLSDCTLDENGQITDDWFFTGTYAYKQWNAGDEELGLAYAFAASDNPDGAAKGKFGKIKAGAFANATRCYLRKRDAKVKLQQQNQAQMVAASPYVARYSINNLPETIDVEFVKNDEKGGRTVLRGRMNTVTGEFKMLRDYDLKGRKVNGVNKARGAYYGKKVLKK